MGKTRVFMFLFIWLLCCDVKARAIGCSLDLNNLLSHSVCCDTLQSRVLYFLKRSSLHSGWGEDDAYAMSPKGGLRHACVISS